MVKLLFRGSFSMRLFRAWPLDTRCSMVNRTSYYSPGPLLSLKLHLSMLFSPLSSAPQLAPPWHCPCSLSGPLARPTFQPMLPPRIYCALLPGYPPCLLCLPITYSSVKRQLKDCLLCEAFPDPHPSLSSQRTAPPLVCAALTVCSEGN